MPLLQKNINLSDLSNYKIGGPASYFLEVKNLDDLKNGLSEFYKEFSKETHPRIFIMGAGTNVLIGDKGFPGLVIKDSISEIKFLDQSKVYSGSGNLFEELLDFCIENSLSGLEWAGGLPGTVGGAIRGNAGAFKGETKDSTFSVKSIDLKTFETFDRTNKECQFGYRTSIFKTDGKEEMILGAVFEFTKGQKEEIEKETQEKIDYRRARHPLEYPNIGSTFKNIPLEKVPPEVVKEFSQSIKDDPFPILPSAKLLAVAGLKGTRSGDAQISEKHPNFIVNLGNASSEDVLALIKIAKNAIKKKYGIELEEEIYYL
ncbi:MAG: UDP-N-acetylenolpyruvoylglucosamine reductase [Candidatus Levybacteria bacterium GW2011_GWA2_40_8]|nr:MAG: UDP-N-acetylenolpyruvoylglucosamine reductase [Candidatus Levybacteria bacterium GW2011_GWA2_40_8]